MSFQQFEAVGQIIVGGDWYLELIPEWSRKRARLILHIQDLPRLVADFANRHSTVYNEHITLYDQVPDMHLANACEGAAHLLYSLAELAAYFGNAITGTLPRSFNSLRKRLDSGAEPALAAAIGDLQWYRKVREIRTEWAHYGTIFVAGMNASNPDLVVTARRTKVDRVEFVGNVTLPVSDFQLMLDQALATMDNLAEYFLHRHMIPRLDQTLAVDLPVYDAKGWPIQNPDHTFQMQRKTIGELLVQFGLQPRPPHQ